jgi:hypothetical protein
MPLMVSSTSKLEVHSVTTAFEWGSPFWFDREDYFPIVSHLPIVK